MPVDSIYLVSEKITPVPKRDIDQLQQKIGSLPLGYREFIERCGSQGSLCGFAQIWSPKDILARGEEQREYIKNLLREVEYEPRPLTKADLDKLWVFGLGELSTFIFSPRHEPVLLSVAHRGATNEGTLIRH